MDENDLELTRQLFVELVRTDAYLKTNIPKDVLAREAIRSARVFRDEVRKQCGHFDWGIDK